MKRILVVATMLIAFASLSACGPRDSKGPQVKESSVVTTTTVNYSNCKKMPGAVYRGEPGYRKELDRDNDGIACNK